MNFRSWQPLDVSAGVLAIVLVVAIGAVMMLGNWIGIRVYANSLDQEVGPYGPLTLTFSQPVDPDAILDRFSLEPEVSGRFEWADEKTLHFVPDTPLRAGTNYQLALSTGPIGANGEVLRKEQSWPVHVRTPKVVYLVPTNGPGQIWIADSEGKTSQRLDHVDKKIFDYAAAPNGDFIIFSGVNDSNGIDLWYLDRNGNSHILLDCGADHCITPAVSPDSLQVAYTRQTGPVSSSVPMGAPRPWIFNIQSRDNRPVYADSQIIGYGPGWSPDGKYLTSYDGLKKLIQVVPLDASGQGFTLPCNTGNAPAWAPDSKSFVATNVAETLDGFRTQIQMANIETGEVSIWMGAHDVADYQYSELAWWPREDEILVSMRARPASPSRILLLMQPDALSGMTVADGVDSVYLYPQWDPWGESLLFSQFQLTGKYEPKIAVWHAGLQDPLVIASGTDPHWLP
jgi:Tol biopolymer transport system component